MSIKMPSIAAIAAPPPAFKDIAKATDDLLIKDFYHSKAQAFEVRLRTPNNASVKITGNSTHPVESAVSPTKVSHAGPCAGSVEVKQTVYKGVPITINSTTGSLVTAKVELDGLLAPGLKTEVAANYDLKAGPTMGNIAFLYKQPTFNLRAFFSEQNGRHASFDGVAGRDGFLVGGEVKYNIIGGEISNYNVAAGYQHPNYSASAILMNKTSLLKLSYFQFVNKFLDAGLQATYNLTTRSNPTIELAGKYKIDPASFAKAKINQDGLAWLSYNTRVNSGFTFGIGAAVNTSDLRSATHKIGTSFTFEA